MAFEIDKKSWDTMKNDKKLNCLDFESVKGTGIET